MATGGNEITMTEEEMESFLDGRGTIGDREGDGRAKARAHSATPPPKKKTQQPSLEHAAPRTWPPALALAPQPPCSPPAPLPPTPCKKFRGSGGGAGFGGAGGDDGRGGCGRGRGDAGRGWSWQRWSGCGRNESLSEYYYIIVTLLSSS